MGLLSLAYNKSLKFIQMSMCFGSKSLQFWKNENGRRLTRNSDNKLSPLILAVDGSHKLLSSVQKKYLICLVVLGNPFGRFKGINTTPFVRQEKNEWYQLTLWVVIVNLKLTN